MEEYVLEANNITKRFPGIIANQDITLKAKKSEILGLIGENGAGKSTFLGILNGMYPYGSYDGIIKVEGKEIQNYSTLDSSRYGIGFVPQEINVLKNLTVAENIYISQLTKGSNSKTLVSHKGISREAKKLLDEYKICLDPSSYARVLSIGQQQLLMIARALAKTPKVMILDEPTTSLTKKEIENLYEIMQGLKQKGTTIIFVSHKIDEIMNMTDRVIIFRDGRNVNLYEKENYDKEKIVEGMIGRKIDKMYPKRNVKIGEEVLRIENISVEHPRIKDRFLINDISLKLNKGEVLGIAGLVGAGRTEVLKTIYGALKRKAGQMYICGKQVEIENEKDAINNGIAFVTEDRKTEGLLFLRDILSNITINNLGIVSKLGIISPKKLKNRGFKYYDLLRVKARSINDHVDSLSGGNQQKVIIGRALNIEPSILLLDEPTKGIDVGSKNEIYNLINDLSNRGVSIIMVSSELPEVLEMCDRIVVMADGTIKGELSKEKATEKNVMLLAT